MDSFSISIFVLSNIGLLGNICATFIIITKKLWKEVRFFILQNLIIEDTIFLVITNIQSIWSFSARGPPPKHLRLVVRGVTSALLCLSMMLSAMLMLDRLLSIFLHLRYHSVVTKCKVRMSVAVIWLFGVGCGTASLILQSRQEKLRSIWMPLLVIPTWCFIFISNISIEKIRQYHMRKITSNRNHLQGNQNEKSDQSNGILEFFNTTSVIIKQIKIINWATLLLLTIPCIQSVCQLVGVTVIPSRVVTYSTLMYVSTNSYVYMLTMYEMKRYIVNLLCKKITPKRRDSQSTGIDCFSSGV